ncbi:hypothetical protein ES319_D10G189100v1 [Gossypium barbadense]|uniref:Uncharacterized protein n=1 Tax=Gossypium barbadense TaxID=3634 RepID=A0A5J5PSP2_GOSBA|nr:hypothetical protein ES319_D10G189100v1 [Gossypium barbadense]
MASSDSTPPLPLGSAPLPPKKENITPVGSKIAELNESRTELLNRIQGLKQDLKNWRSKLDTQVKIYRDLQDVSEGAKEAEHPKVKLEGKDEETLTSPIKENGNEVNI